ncbi:MAG: hypothetical protein MZV63_45570 [Marinilabiliales bacterium]|nr:hypothetical protein [Marinilabiliales bacterium]
MNGTGRLLQLFEADSIGWAWWTLKKLDSESGIMSVIDSCRLPGDN